MKSVYEREDLRITEFETEDVITTSGITPDPVQILSETDNRHVKFSSFKLPGTWF